MRTLELTAEQMQARVSLFKDLKPLPLQNDPNIPLEAKDIIYSRKLLSVIGLEDARTPINQGAPIKGAGGMTMTHAVCPPGQGPSLHAHGRTYETFTVLKGRFEISWNDDGAERLVLEALDTISVPPGVCRAFRNVGEEEGILQVLISGGVHDLNDIDFPPEVADKLDSIGPGVLGAFEEQGLTFTAGKARGA